MMLSLFNDEDILIELGKRYEEIRLEKRLSDADVSLRGGVPTNAIYRFKKGQGISFTNFIKILRGLDKLDKLDSLFQEVGFSIKESKEKKPKRIFKSKKIESPDDFKWGGDDQ